METIKCQECEKELSKKAEICPNCGVRIKKKGILITSLKIGKGLVWAIIIIAILSAGFITLKSFFAEKNREERRKSFVGTWRLQTPEEKISYSKTANVTGPEGETTVTHDYTILIDRELIITDENAYYGSSLSSCTNPDAGELEERCENVPPVVRLNMHDEIVAINFTRTDGDSVLLCFEKDDDTIKQVSCEKANTDGVNSTNFSANGGIDQEFNIIYQKVD